MPNCHVVIGIDNVHVIAFLSGGPQVPKEKVVLASAHNWIMAIKSLHNLRLMPRHVKAHTAGKDGRSYANAQADKFAREGMRVERKRRRDGGTGNGSEKVFVRYADAYSRGNNANGGFVDPADTAGVVSEQCGAV